MSEFSRHSDPMWIAIGGKPSEVRQAPNSGCFMSDSFGGGPERGYWTAGEISAVEKLHPEIIAEARKRPVIVETAAEFYTRTGLYGHELVREALAASRIGPYGRSNK